ncbi:MAG: hypothetical protein L0Z53_19815, partial [Acidobacteriales bacterium]|nr:hypothetical protein [Terriglobales bacterium]
PAKLLFPYSMIAAALVGSIGYIALALALLQGVFYGSVAGAAKNRRLAIGVILALHTVAIVVAQVSASNSF